MSSDLIAKWKACGQNKSDLNYENKLADFSFLSQKKVQESAFGLSLYQRMVITLLYYRPIAQRTRINFLQTSLG